MNKPIIFLSVLLSLFLTDCKVNKNLKSKNEVKDILNNEVTVRANKNDEEPYQPSAKRVNDILHTRLEIRFDYINQQVIGKATITIKPYFYPVSTLDLDAKYFVLNRVAMIEKDTVNLKFTYDNSVIHIELGREYKNNETYKIFIDYIANPSENKQKGSAAISDTKGIYFINPLHKDADKPREIWTQGETQSNSGWFPTNDVPNEKMTHEIFITVDENDVTLSNGELIYSKINNDKTRTDYWKQDLPIAPYLVMMAVGEFDIVKDKWRDTVDVNYYVEHSFKPYAKLIFGNTPEMLEFFSTKLGIDYPWNKFSQIVVRDFVSGAMENVSAVVHSEVLNHDAREHLDNTYENVISHELFHHWFGDLVTCESWSNIPLNESFATYGEYLWNEHKYGRMEADKDFDKDLTGYLGQKNKYKADLIRFHYNNREDLFDIISYQKGGRVLHMLRKYVGDDAFFKSLQLYLSRNKYKTVEIHDLRLAFEEVTGEDMNWFFNQWFLGNGHPKLVVNYSFDAGRKNVSVTVEQKQDSTFGLFKLPVDIDIYAGGKVLRKNITVEKAKENFTFSSETQINMVNFDAEKMLLADINEKKSLNEYYFMFLHAPLYLDKLKAERGILSHKNDSSDYKINDAITFALADSFYGLRMMGLNMIGTLPKNEEIKYSDNVLNLLKNDKKSFVRASAIGILSEMDSVKFKSDFVNVLTDSSYTVCISALQAIAVTDPDFALIKAAQFKDSKNGMLQSSYANLIGEYGKGEIYISYFQNNLGKYGFYKYGILYCFGNFLQRNDDAVLMKSIKTLHEHYTQSILNADFYTMMMIKRIQQNLSDKYIQKINGAEAQKKKLKSGNDAELVKLNQVIDSATAMKMAVESVSSPE